MFALWLEELALSRFSQISFQAEKWIASVSRRSWRWRTILLLLWSSSYSNKVVVGLMAWRGLPFWIYWSCVIEVLFLFLFLYISFEVYWKKLFFPTFEETFQFLLEKKLVAFKLLLLDSLPVNFRLWILSNEPVLWRAISFSPVDTVTVSIILRMSLFLFDKYAQDCSSLFCLYWFFL